MQMRTRFELNQVVVWKNKYGIFKGRVVGLRDDFIFIRETIVTPGGMKLTGKTVYRVEFEDIIARV
ncbi:hypothetical protein LCGC14_1580940 [marine sediment metagenome]|uniref:Uncharacterized protein n=1 Tax=marine sediment metagenome TaxID=412755 RepID=A0A0F9LH28_9ZZZZ